MFDATKFRNIVKKHVALAAYDIVWNDKRKDGTRRLKLEGSGEAVKLPLKQQWALHDALRAAFGKRFLGLHTVQSMKWWQDADARLLCIELKN